MISAPRLVPNENTRVRHTARATVIDHVVYTTGRWWWKQQFHSLVVRLSDDERDRVARILEAVPTGELPKLSLHRQEFTVGMSSISERDSYPIGEELEVLFSTSNGIEAFFTGAQLFRWDGIRRINAVTEKTA